jgi:hypothetical protein
VLLLPCAILQKNILVFIFNQNLGCIDHYCNYYDNDDYPIGGINFTYNPYYIFFNKKKNTIFINIPN